MALDLNALRETLDRNLGKSNSLPTEPRRQIVVDNDGNIKMGNQIQPGEQTTQVPQETFA